MNALIDNEHMSTPSSGVPLPLGNPPQPQKSFWFIALLIGGLFGVLLAVGVFAYSFMFAGPKPEELLAEGFETLRVADSYSIVYRGAGDELDFMSATVDYHKDKNLFSAVRIYLSFEEEYGDAIITALLSQDDAYFQAQYSLIEEFLFSIQAIMPELFETKTYAVLRPVFSGERWIHIALPEQTDGTDDLYAGTGLSEMDFEKISQDFLTALKFTSFEKHGGEYQIGVGFNKVKLIAFLESLKNYKLDIELSDVNSLIELVESSDGWQEELAQVRMRQDSRTITSIDLFVPDISIEDIKETVSEGLGNGESRHSAYLEYLPFFQSREETRNGAGKAVRHIGSFSFSNYNAAPRASRPANIVEFESILKTAEEDLPIFLGLFLGVFGSADLEASLE